MNSFTEPLLIHEERQEDELIVATENCVEMPDKGWHRTFGYMNGTIQQFHDDRDLITIDGEEYGEGDHFEIWEPADWYPVCDCQESCHVAMRLDPPPGKMTRGSEGGIYYPNGTIEAPYAEVTENGTIVYPDTEVAPEDVTSDGIYFKDGFLELTGPINYGAGMVEADGTNSRPRASALSRKATNRAARRRRPRRRSGRPRRAARARRRRPPRRRPSSPPRTRSNRRPRRRPPNWVPTLTPVPAWMTAAATTAVPLLPPTPTATRARRRRPKMAPDSAPSSR